MILRHADERNQRVINKGRLVHLRDHLPRDCSGSLGTERRKGAEGSVLVILRLIEAGHIDARNGGGRSQKFHAASALIFEADVEINQLKIGYLALSHIEKVKEICNWFRIVGAGAAADDDRIRFCSLLCMQGNARELQYLKNVRVAHLVLKCDSQKVTLPHRTLTLQREEGDMSLPHETVQICPRRKDTLTVDILPPVEHAVKYLYAEMAHADLVDIRKTHGEAHCDLIRVFFYHIDLTADVAGGLLNL